MPTPPAPNLRSIQAALRELAEPIVARAGAELVAIELVGTTEGRVARFSIDKPGGISAGECASVSRQLSPALDVADLIAGSYALEVSSPGLERPVQRPQDWEYFVGCTVRVKTWGMDGRRRLKAVIDRVEDGVVHLVSDAGDRAVPIDEIERANLVLDLDQFARLGEGLHPLADHGGAPRPSRGDRP